MYQEPFLRISEEYGGKIPFYLTYPMTNAYLTEKEYEKDMERMKELYPKRMRRLLTYVEEECDKMEYEGSMMFDEYPDRVLLWKVANDIYDNAMADETDRKEKGRDRDFLEMIQVLLYDEMYRRRSRRRRCCRKWW